MPKPLIAILSQQPRYASELPALLCDRYDFLACDSVDEARELLASRRPAGLLADFERTRGGHQEDQLLDELQSRLPDMAIVMLAEKECAEPLERRAAMSTVKLLKGVIELAEVTAALDGCFDEAAAAAATKQLLESTETSKSAGKPHADFVTTQDKKQPVEQAVETPAEQLVEQPSGSTVLEGITRQFETRTPEMVEMLGDLEIAARHDVTILLIGETGSGRTFLSKLIHEVSPRRDEPFLHVACGALPSELILSELFGHQKGSFTSAHADKEGKFVAAGRGTVLLDEIDVLGPEQQVKLLKVIETGEFEPVGSNQTLKSQARLVVASNLNLQPLVEQGKFRPDLYYRLNMLKFEVLPLRVRIADIRPMAERFIEKLSEKHGVKIQRVDESLYGALVRYPWPGNVRELENVIQRAVIYCRDGILSSGQLPSHILAGEAGPTNDPTVVLGGSQPRPKELGNQIAQTEKDIIEQALFKNNFSRTNTAKQLGISRVTLYNKMKKYGVS